MSEVILTGVDLSDNKKGCPHSPARSFFHAIFGARSGYSRKGEARARRYAFHARL
jgi:hypothetical protein